MTTAQTQEKSVNYKNPLAPKGSISYEWNTDLDEAVACHLYYQAPCKGAWERGERQISPDEPASMTLNSAWLRGLNIVTILTEAQIQDIEYLALEDMEGEARDDY